MVASPHGGQKEGMRSGKMMKRGAESSRFIPCSWGKSEEEMGSGRDVERGIDEEERPCGEI